MKRKVILYYSRATNSLRLLYPDGYVELLDLDTHSRYPDWCFSEFTRRNDYRRAKKHLDSMQFKSCEVDSE